MDLLGLAERNGVVEGLVDRGRFGKHVVLEVEDWWLLFRLDREHRRERECSPFGNGEEG